MSVLGGTLLVGKLLGGLRRILPRAAQTLVESGIVNVADKPKVASLLQRFIETDPKIQKEIQTELESVLDFWSQYEGDPAEQSKFVQVLRAIPRPAISLSVTGYCLYFSVTHGGAFPSQEWYYIFMMVVGFYFAFRSVEKMRFLTKGKKGGEKNEH